MSEGKCGVCISVTLPFLALALTAGALAGAYLSGSLVDGAVAGALYALITWLSAWAGWVPVIGPFIYWFWLRPVAKAMVPIGQEGPFIVVDIICLIDAIAFTVVGTMLALALMALVSRWVP